VNSHSSHKLIDALKRLLTQQPIEGAKYYCLTLTADHEGKLWTSVYSKFAGYSSGTPQFELRRPSHVQPENTRSSLEQINEPAFMVNDLDDAVAFVLIGGHAIINTEIAVTLFPHALTVENCAPLGAKPGFIAATAVPRSKFVKRPRPWMKKRARERDGGKCCICGKGPGGGVELTLHHIIMRKWAGFTELDNLITLCRSCHDEYGELNNLSLYELVGVNRFSSDTSGREHREATERYRMKLRSILSWHQGSIGEPGTY
jgi:hypothetical protein